MLNYDDIKNINFERIGVLYKKCKQLSNGNLYNITNIEEFFSQEELLYLSNIYKILEADIKTYIFKKNLANLKFYSFVSKLFFAWERLSYIKDNRTVQQLLLNVSKNWVFEDFIFQQVKNFNYLVKLNGSDALRHHSLLDFSSIPDITINKIPVEIQQGNNCFLKQNKINRCLSQKAFILYYYHSNDNIGYHLFSPNELININKGPVKVFYGFKEGKTFDIVNYEWDTLENTLKKWFFPSKKNNIKNNY